MKIHSKKKKKKKKLPKTVTKVNCMAYFYLLLVLIHCNK